jgi:hypothetical protein
MSGLLPGGRDNLLRAKRWARINSRNHHVPSREGETSHNSQKAICNRLMDVDWHFRKDRLEVDRDF